MKDFNTKKEYKKAWRFVFLTIIISIIMTIVTAKINVIHDGVHLFVVDSLQVAMRSRIANLGMWLLLFIINIAITVLLLLFIYISIGFSLIVNIISDISSRIVLAIRWGLLIAMMVACFKATSPVLLIVGARILCVIFAVVNALFDLAYASLRKHYREVSGDENVS